MATPATQPGRGFHAKVHLLRFGIGILPFLVLASPFIAGLVSYEIAKMSGSASPLVWARGFGFGVLFFFLVVLPVYMLGEALQLSRRPESQPKQSGGESVTATALPSVGVNGKLKRDNPPGIVGSDPRNLLRTKWVDRSARVLRNGAANGSLIANLCGRHRLYGLRR